MTSTFILQHSDPHSFINLEKILDKCIKENIEGVKEPLEIDHGNECIICTWCDWKGSQLVKVINQHIKKSITHKKERAHVQGLPTGSPPQTSTRSYFVSANTIESDPSDM